MSDLRTAAQQALEALAWKAGSEPALYGAQTLQAITALRAALAQQDESETCTWHQDGDSDSGVYATSCRRFFNLTDGTPEDNKMQWCCYCGKRLVQELITEDGDE